MKTINSTLNIFKALACIGIIIMHCKFPDPAAVGGRAVGCFGVPLFFCVSGFFLANAEKMETEKIVNKCKHVIGLIVFSEAFYIIFSILYYQLQREDKRKWFLKTILSRAG